MTAQIPFQRRPGRAGVSFEAVAAAADSLLREGTNPTTDKVLARLPSGSTGKVCEHMRQWWASRQPSVHANLPEYTIDDAVVGAIRREIQTKVEAVTAEYKRRTEEAEKDREAVVHESHQVSEELDQLQRQHETLKAELAERQGALAELRTRLDKSEEHEGSLRNEIERIRLEAAADRNRIAHAAMAETLISDLNSRLAASEARRNESEANLAAAMMQNAKIQDTLNVLTAQLDGVLAYPRPSTPTSEANLHVGRSTVTPAAQVEVTQTGGNEVASNPANTKAAKTIPPMRRPASSKDSRSASAAATVLKATAALIRARGPMAISEIRTELSKGDTPRCDGKALRSLSAILSKSRSVTYSHIDGRWRLNENESKHGPGNGQSAPSTGED